MATHAPACLHVSHRGICYSRVAIPTQLRTHPGAREVKRSLKTRHRRTAVQRARACAIQCETLFAPLQQQRVTYLEMKQLLQEAKDAMSAILKNGLETGGPLTCQGRTEFAAELRMLRTFIGINKYTPRAQEMADALLANNNICLPQGSDTYRQFCVEATKMLDALFQAHLEHSEALDGYVNTPKPAPATMRRCSDCCF